MMQDVVQKVLEGDKEAFRAIVVELGPGIRAYLAAHLNDSHTVDDLAQETFVAAYESLGRFETGADLSNWLRGIAQKKLLGELRRQYKGRSVLADMKVDLIRDISTDVIRTSSEDSSGTIKKLQECLGKLPERTKSVLLARYFDRETVTAVAGRMETSVTAISALLFRGRKQLQVCMERNH